MKESIVVFLLLAAVSAFAQQNPFTYKIAINTVDSSAASAQREAGEKILHEVLPQYTFTLDQNGTFLISTPEEINPQLLETDLQTKNITLTYFEKYQLDREGNFVFVVYYKPKNRDRHRVKP